eukprot:RCo041363
MSWVSGTHLRVLYGFEAQGEGELSVSAEETVVCLGTPQHRWVLVHSVASGKEGYVPVGYVEPRLSTLRPPALHALSDSSHLSASTSLSDTSAGSSTTSSSSCSACSASTSSPFSVSASGFVSCSSNFSSPAMIPPPASGGQTSQAPAASPLGVPRPLL